jgi:hypothetical protein
LYDTAKTEASKGALVELALALRSYRKDIVLAGGWAPYFLTQGYLSHCGSIDLDLVLRPSIVIRYENIREIVVDRLRYAPTAKIFKFEKPLKDTNGKPFSVELDFLTEPKAARDAGLVKVQDGLEAVLIEGSGIAFDFNYEEEVKGIIPGNGEATATIQVVDIVGSLTMKGLALGRREKLEKDSYDIYSVAGFHRGSPARAAEQFKHCITEHGSGKIPTVTDTALGRIYNGFETQSSFASQAVSRFVMSDVSLDARERIEAFRENVGN